ncbi:MAG: hypothetical protein ACRD5K_15395 [Candidatus Acidiferrales bacterium]
MGKPMNSLLLGLLLVAGTAWLMSDPKCGRGCKSVLEHLLTHELEALLGA